MKTSIFATLLMSLTIFTPTIFADVERNIYLVRHAEKQSDAGKDPLLTEIGQQRALNIADMLRDKNITAIYSSDYHRTKQTAQPLAKLLGLKVIIYDPSKLKVFAEQILNTQGNLLIVGHSNTTPGLAVLLGGQDFGEIDHAEYHRVYQIMVGSKKTSTKLLFSKPTQSEYSNKNSLKENSPEKE